MLRDRQRARATLAFLARSRVGTSVLRPMALRGWVPADLWRRMPAPDVFEVELLPGHFSYTNSLGDLNARGLYWRGVKGFEPFALGACIALFRRCSHFVDVGANTGIYTLSGLAANPNLIVTAFEPTPRFLAVLDANIALNGWHERVRRFDSAVADEEGSANFVLPEGVSPYSARLAAAEYRTQLPASYSDELVSVVKLDNAMAGTVVDLVKIDVEGAEHLVLMGARELLATSLPTVMFECHPEADVAATQQLLRELGYTFFQLDGPKPRAVKEVRPVADRHLNNFLAIARPDHLSVVASIGRGL